MMYSVFIKLYICLLGDTQIVNGETMVIFKSLFVLFAVVAGVAKPPFEIMWRGDCHFCITKAVQVSDQDMNLWLWMMFEGGQDFEP